MSMLKAMNTTDKAETPTDYTGGQKILTTDIYAAQVDIAYLTESKKGALGVVVHLKTPGDVIHKQTVWMTSNKENGCKNFYTREGKNYFMPGFLLADSLAWLTMGQSIADIDTEKKIVPVYNYELRKEINTEVDMLVELQGQEIWAAVEEQIVDKNKLVGDQYVPSGETRRQAELVRFYRADDKMTKVEIDAGLEAPENHDKWLTAHKGQVRDRSTKDTGNAGVAGAPAANASGKSKVSFGGGAKAAAK